MLEGANATKEKVDIFWAELVKRCYDHKKKMESEGQLANKFVIAVYYSGHGHNSDATQRVCLVDDQDYPLEDKIRSFKNDHVNCFIFGIFDSCRDLQRSIEVPLNRQNQ